MGKPGGFLFSRKKSCLRKSVPYPASITKWREISAIDGEYRAVTPDKNNSGVSVQEKRVHIAK